MHLQEKTLFDLEFPLHHVIYASTKFEVARSYGLGEDTITRNVTDGQTQGQKT